MVIFLTQIVAKVALFALSNIISIYWLLIRIARALLSFTIFLLKKIVDIFPMLIAGIYYLILWIRFLCLGIISCFAERWTKICLAWRLIGDNEKLQDDTNIFIAHTQRNQLRKKHSWKKLF